MRSTRSTRSSSSSRPTTTRCRADQGADRLLQTSFTSPRTRSTTSSTLADHLGAAAKYQLLGALFAEQKIPNLEPTVPAIRGSMGGSLYYSFSIEPARLLKMAYVLHRNQANSELMPTYQRLIKKSRLKKVAEFVEEGGFFPNSIILNIETRKKKGDLRFDLASKDSKASGAAKAGSPSSSADLPRRLRHRRPASPLRVCELGSGRDRPDPCRGLRRSDRARAGQAVHADQREPAGSPEEPAEHAERGSALGSDDYNERARALRLRIAQHLGEQKSSPLLRPRDHRREPPRRISAASRSRRSTTALCVGTSSAPSPRRGAKTQGTFYAGDNQPTAESPDPVP